jgi:two-component system, NarL family, sensor kinase
MQEKLPEVALILIAATFIILTLTGLVVISLFINQKRKFKYRHELADMKNIYEREALKTQIETQSQIFESISRELHDNVGILISIALVHLQSLPTKDGKTKEVINLLNESMDTLRDISRSLNPDMISRIGLCNAITHEMKKIRKTNLFNTTFSVEGEEWPIDPSKQIILFRIVQEALNNAMKHSGGNNLVIKMKFEVNGLSISIKDNGKGFQPEVICQSSGLLNMKKRANLLLARLTIDSSEENGTCVSVYFAGEPRLEASRHL